MERRDQGGVDYNRCDFCSKVLVPLQVPVSDHWQFSFCVTWSPRCSRPFFFSTPAKKKNLKKMEETLDWKCSWTCHLLSYRESEKLTVVELHSYLSLTLFRHLLDFFFFLDVSADVSSRALSDCDAWGHKVDHKLPSRQHGTVSVGCFWFFFFFFGDSDQPYHYFGTKPHGFCGHFCLL